MGALVGLLLGLGLALMLWSLTSPRPPARRPATRATPADALAQAGLPGMRPLSVVLAGLGAGAVTFVVVLGVSGALAIAVAFAVLAAYLPLAVIRVRRRRRQDALREAWPDVVDHLASAVRAGLALPEALVQLAERGPDVLRAPFQAFAADYRATGRFGDSLDRLKATLADPVGDRVVEALRTAREVGGSDLGRLLRALSQFLREDARTRAELESRQAWTVNAARLAVAAPWAVLALLALRPESVRAYDTPAGVVVLAVGLAVSVVAYRLMVRIGRLPVEQRVLR